MLNKIIGPLIVVLIGLCALGFGIAFATEKVPECDGKMMHRADTCRQPKRGTNTYDEQLTADHSMGLVMVGGGAAVMIGGVVKGIRNYRRRPGVPRQQASGGAQYYAQSGGPSHYPPPGVPQQYPPPSGPPQYPRPDSPPRYPPPQYPPPQYPPPGPPLRTPPRYPPPGQG
ncbi:hypothetical protein [Mycobacterium asiaticum]|uniref:Uncharacterized protein n=1 Tax=Mycobacterium asiaticum TaxID=1790 RepID=A0A1A3NGY5_MYCAS|nr:hypothetical protein [Mycobacterium asiaticum]OBK20605.1 hypothetical protein A5635_24725 [Mycobacterium asiaticum]